MSPPIRIRMTARSTDEPHRTSSQLELLFDLTFVVAVAALTSRFAHAIGDGHALDALVPVPAGVLRDLVGVDELHVVRVGVRHRRRPVPAADPGADGRRARARRRRARRARPRRLPRGHDRLPDHARRRSSRSGCGRRSRTRRAARRRCATRPAITIAEVAWLLPPARSTRPGCCRIRALLAVFVALVLFELAIPSGRSAGAHGWHPHHIAERYGLFAIILLGEGVFAASTGVERALDAGGVSVPLIAIARRRAGARLRALVAVLPAPGRRRARRRTATGRTSGATATTASSRRSRRVGAGLEVAVEQTGHHVAASPVAVGYAIAIPVAVFLILAVGAARADLLAAGAEARGGLRRGPPRSSLLPLAAAYIALGAVVVAIAAACSGAGRAGREGLTPRLAFARAG